MKQRLGVVVLMLWCGAWALGAPDLATALRESRIKGGLCAVVGAGDAPIAKQITASGPFVVQCLALDGGKVQAAREALLSDGLYGRVSVQAWAGETLPYADQLLSLVVVIEPGRVTEAELMRVVRPFGEVIIRQGDSYRTIVKPMAAGMDQWTHWRHGPDRNPVSTDKLVDVPDRIQWLFTVKAIGERSHFVVSNGRTFAQDRDQIIARDAGNGLPLWKAKIKTGKDVDWDYSVKVAALIATHGERVYALTEDNKLKALDAATGKVEKVFDEAGVPYDIVVVEGESSQEAMVVVLCPDAVRVLDAKSGKLLWKENADRPHNLIVTRQSVFFIQGNDRRGASEGRLCSRDLKTGKAMWDQKYDWARRTELASYGSDHLVFEMRSPFNYREFYAANPEQKKADNYRLVVVSAKTGKEIQKLEKPATSARHGEFFRGFWYKDQLLIETNTKEGLGIGLFDLDNFAKPATVFKANFVGDKGWGHCYPPVLTDRFYINGQLNFTNIQTHKQTSNQITRGACNTAREGYIPAYGMLYTFPKHCVCFPMLDGNVCMAPAAGQPMKETTELVRGAAWGTKGQEVDYSADWPMFRHDASRSAGTEQGIAGKLEVLWEAEIAGPDYKDAMAAEWLDSPYIGGPVSAPVIGQGMVFVAQSDTHRLIALDAASGKQRWAFVAGGRIDGPPTLHQGMCLFGSRDGWVYNLRAIDGALIWKRRIAANDRQISVYGQLESPWPVPASVLVIDGLGYACAGLHPNSDGGVRVVCFRPESGELVWTNTFDNLGMGEPWPGQWQPGPDRDPWRNIWPKEYRYFDMLVRDGDCVAVSRCLFDLKTGKRELRKTSGSYQIKETGAYLPRTAWRYGIVRQFSPLAVSRAGMVFGTVPGVDKLFRVDFQKGAAFDTEWVNVPKERVEAGLWTATSKLLEKGAKWTTESGESKTALNRAMLVAGDRLVIVNPKGDLVIRSIADGQKVATFKPGIAAYESVAAAGGRLYLTTQEGKVICLGGK